MEQYNESVINQEVPVTHHPSLTSSEIANLWQSFMNYSMLHCVGKHFMSHVEDPDARRMIEDGMGIFDIRVKLSSEFLSRGHHPIPRGFDESDIDLTAPRLFADEYYLYYLLNMVRLGMSFNSMALTNSARTDIRDFFTRCLDASARFFNQIVDVMLAKGIFIRPPFITTINQVDMVRRQDFLAGFLGPRRPLTAVEVEHLAINNTTNLVGKTLLTGFKQTSISEPVRRHMARGAAIAGKHADIFSQVLRSEDITSPMHWNLTLTDSTTPPFSDRLMMYHVMCLSTIGITNYAAAISQSIRHDLTTDYVRLMAETANYAEDGLNIMIEHGWFEEPPRVVDREHLTNREKH